MAHEEFDVPVSGGLLRACRWPGTTGAGPVVLAVHGITANALSFAPLATALAGRLPLVAPDLRGRAGSVGLPGPYGLAAHADDLVAILDHLGQERAVIIGHSMGGFVAALTAVRHPDRIERVVLVDGGVTLAVPDPSADIDAILDAVIGPAIRRLHMTFETRESYIDFWRSHPALWAHWSPEVEAYALRDLVGTRSSCDVDVIRADARDTLVNPDTTTAFQHLPCPATLLWAQRGMQDEPQGLYDERRLGAVNVPFPHTRVDDVNHYTILLSPTGAAAIAATL